MPETCEYNIPDKLYFRIGEVSDIVGVKPYVLRYWETEFTDVKPTKSKSGQRLYKRRDVELLLNIKDLLYSERFTINGAKQRLKELGKITGSSQMSLIEQREEGREEAVPASAPQRAQRSSKEQPAVSKKLLQKIKGDLNWCLNELRNS